MTYRILSIAALIAASLFGCSPDDIKPDASGTFEAVELMISAEASGRIESLAVHEGIQLVNGQVVGHVDTTQLALKKRQLEAQISAVLRKRPDVATQLAALQEQLRTAQRERDRVQRLRDADAATPKQADDATSVVVTLQRQIDAMRSTLGTTVQGLEGETQPLMVQIEQVEDQLRKSRITSPTDGTVLATYAEQYEVTAPGRALFKMADLRTMTLRAYVTGDQFSSLKIGQKVKVLVDQGNGGQRAHQGTITWVSDKAEFTPKTIQTKDERANLVYAIKITVPNDGTIKIGMYGDVQF